MKFTTYFLKHPVVALVLNAMIILLGVLCFDLLQVREYPPVSFPVVTVTASYPNASAELVETSVTNKLEDKLAGVSGLDTIQSWSSKNSCNIEMTFKSNTNIDQVLISIRDAVGMAKDNLPNDVKEPIIERKTKSGGPPFLVISLESDSMGFGELTHYAEINLKNGFRSLNGVSESKIWGQPFTYRITLDPKKMYTFGVNANEIYDVIKRGNISLPVGKFQNEISSTLNSELKTKEDYENLVIKNFDDPKKQPIFLKFVSKIELKSNDESIRVRVNGKQGLCIAIDRTTDSNPLEVSNLVREHVKKLQESLPSGINAKVIIDQADFIRSSIKNIQSSIFEAIIFVLLIVFLFLRNIRATLIPLITIPISLIGSFLFLKIFGFSINIMTLLAMVLAIGLVVDDAIVVLENISRHIEEGLSPFEASIKGAKEIGFAIIAMTLTLASVYAPIAFISGTVGQLFSEFAIALAGSVIISGFVALTLSPLMCANIIKSDSKHFLPKIDIFINSLTDFYGKVLSYVIDRKKTVLVIAFSSIGLSYFFLKILPGEMAPKEDRSLIGIQIPPVPGKDINFMEKKEIEIENIAMNTSEVSKSTIERLSFVADWGGVAVFSLKPQNNRKLSSEELVSLIRPKVMSFPSIDAYAWNWSSSLPGLSSMSGSDLSVEISTTDSYRDLFDAVEKVRKIIEGKKIFESVNHDLNLDSMGYSIDLNANMVSKLGLSNSQIAKTIEIFFSGDNSLDFSKDGILYNISLKGGNSPWSLNSLYLINKKQQHIPISAVANIKTEAQPKELSHNNQMRSVMFSVKLFENEKIETAMPKLMKILKENLPSGYKKTWAGAAKAQSESSQTMTILFILAIIFIFAILSIQFESFIDPLIILFTVPLACSGALFVTWLFGQSINIYTQVGLITLVGLITKHGILMVEFSNQLIKEGKQIRESIQEACKMRLRPILMTTLAMILGVLPLLLSKGDGAEARHVIGAVLVGGLGFGTLFTIFVLPTVCYVVKSSVVKFSKK